MRISKTTSDLPAIHRGKTIEVIIDGRKVQAYEGELVSTVLLAEEISIFGYKHTTGRPAGIYCGMGVCYECLVTINGTTNLRACQTYASDRMVVETTGHVKP